MSVRKGALAIENEKDIGISPYSTVLSSFSRRDAPDSGGARLPHGLRSFAGTATFNRTLVFWAGALADLSDVALWSLSPVGRELAKSEPSPSCCRGPAR